ncbi:MAG: hypothetical protein NC430_07285 [bacterium]|nr:hypothetical protein [bacterium]MCM1423617.1 hypothetical protein [bacterium]
MGRKKRLLLAVLGAAVGIATGEQTIGKARKKAMRRLEEDDMKFHEFYAILLQWVHIHNEGKTVGAYLKKSGYNTVAIYGMKELGEELLYELKDSEIEVKYGIDKNADELYVGTDVYRPDEELEAVDAVIVTAVHWFDDIERDMKEKLGCPVLSLDDVIYDA